MPSRIVIWSVISQSPRFFFFLVEQNCWATMTSLSLQSDALYQLYIWVAVRIAVELLWFLLLVCVFREVSCRCVKSSLTRRLKFVRWRGTCPVENVLGLLRKGGKKNPSAACFCVFLALFRYLYAQFFPPLKTDFWTVKEKTKVEKVFIMCILFEFLASFLKLVPLSNLVFPFLWLAVGLWEHILTDW